MLTTALCAATICGGVMAMTNVSADEITAKKYSITEVFSASGSATISAGKVATEDAAETASFKFTKESDSVKLKRDIAYKWFEGANQAKYLNFSFAFADTNFTDASFIFETAPAQATEGDKAVNTVKFVNESGAISVKIVNGKGDAAVESTAVSVSGTEMKVALAEGDEYGEFKVLVNNAEVGKFLNVGSNFADLTSMDTLVMKANVASESTMVYFQELNGQKFDNIVDESGKKMVADTAAPVLVVNSEVNAFLLGTPFKLEYEKIDVLKSSSLTEEKKYYQWNPADEKVAYSNVLSTSTYFMDTVYYTNGTEVSATAKEGYNKTSVYREEGQEYVSIRFALGDETYKGDNKKEYFLDWYVADAAATAVKTLGTEDTTYILVNRNENGPTYSNVTVDDATGENKLAAEWNTLPDYKKFVKELQEAAAKIYAGSNAELNLPSLEWLFNDNNGYQGLAFTISYKTPSSTTAKTSSKLAYNKLKISAPDEGAYEFKIFASDSADNAMMYYVDGELVKVTSSNVWDIEEIPSFTYTIKNLGIKAKDGEDTDTLDSEVLDDTYVMSDVTIVGASSKQSAYTLYKLDLSKYNNTLTGGATRLTNKILSEIKFATLKTAVDSKLLSVTDGNYFELYKNEYIKALANKVNGNVEDVAKIFVKEIAEYDSSITEDDKSAWNASDNKFKWDPSARSFKLAEEGVYIIIADYWDSELSFVDRVMAYQLVEVEAEEDVIRGETNWLKNNLVSVILFSIAGVMLILIIILLLVKPSEETLEDVEKKESKKADKKKEK